MVKEMEERLHSEYKDPREKGLKVKGCLVFWLQEEVSSEQETCNEHMSEGASR